MPPSSTDYGTLLGVSHLVRNPWPGYREDMSVIEIQPGQGGLDAQQFAADLGASITAWATRNRHPSRTSTTTRAVTIALPRTDAGLIRWLSGTHRIQHIPGERVRSGNQQRQTSYVTVVVLDAATPPPVSVILRRGDPDIIIDTFRGRGKGGQARNTTDSSVRVRHRDWPGLVVTRIDGRSQTVNLEDALAELGQRIADAARSGQAATINESRRLQASPVIAFNHTAFRDRVEHLDSGQTWPLRVWAQGRFDAPEGYAAAG